MGILPGEARIKNQDPEPNKNFRTRAGATAI